LSLFVNKVPKTNLTDISFNPNKKNFRKPTMTQTSPGIRSNQRILALVDESHLLSAARSLNKSIDWIAVREYLLDAAQAPVPQALRSFSLGGIEYGSPWVAVPR
jgi:hypothetical protein